MVKAILENYVGQGVTGQKPIKIWWVGGGNVFQFGEGGFRGILIWWEGG